MIRIRLFVANFNKILTLVVALLFVTPTFFTLSAQEQVASDVPLMFRCNAQRTGVCAGEELSGELSSVLWRFATKNSVESTPAVYRNRVYFGSNDGNVYAVRLETGEQIWSFETDDPIKSSPAIEGSLLYIGGLDKNFYALNTEDGKLVWKFAMKGAVTASPAIDGDTIYIGTDDGSLYALDKTSGKQKWVYKVSGAITTSPAVGYGKVFFGSHDSTLYAVDTVSGKYRWDFRTDVPLRYTPSLTDGRIIFAAADWREGYKVHIWSLAVNRGNLLWRESVDGMFGSSPIIMENKIYLRVTTKPVDKTGSIYSDIYKFTLARGGEIWHHRVAGGVSTPMMFSGGKILFGCYDGSLKMLNAENQSEVTFKGLAADEYPTTGFIVKDGTLIFGSSRGELIRLK